MRKIFIAALCFALAVCAAGCAAKTSEIPNPMEELPSAEDFAELGVSIDAPEGATDVKYFIISGKLAQVSFTLDGRDFTYRCADEDEGDITGVYDEFRDEELAVNAEYPDGCIEVRIRTTIDGGRLATWENGGKTFSLFTVSEMSDDEITSLCLRLCEA